MKFRLIVEPNSTVLQLRAEDEYEQRLLGSCVKGKRDGSVNFNAVFQGYESYGKIESLAVEFP